MYVNRLASFLCCESIMFSIFYLRLPISANMKLSMNWIPVVDKFKAKPSKWKTTNLSFGGQLTLVKSILGSLMLYYFSLFKAPRKVIDTLEGIRVQSLWGGIDDKMKINWVAWSTLVKLKNKGGLGIRYLHSLNVALLVKWLWRLKLEINSLWYKSIKAWHNILSMDGKPLIKVGLSDVWLAIATINVDLEQ